MTFDILSDSALEIATQLITDAWGGDAPIGGLDFPSSCVLSKCGDEYSDVHVELGIVDDTLTLSEIPWLADVTHSDVAGPGDTDTPFRFPSGEATPPGLFGKALRSYGEVMAICVEYGVDTTCYDIWFRSQWGVDKDTDLSMAIPVTRSHGDALWGGLGRKLAPASYTHLAASKQIRVVWHGTQRDKFGAHKLVDWPRLTALVRTIGAALLLEDRHAHKRVKRFDFRVVSREIPNAPEGIGTNLTRIPVMDSWDTRDISRGAVEFIQGFRQSALLLARYALGNSGALVVEEGCQIPSSSIIKFLSEPKVGALPHFDFLDMGEPVFDLDDKPSNPVRFEPIKETVSIFRAFGAVVRPFVEKNFHQMPFGYILRMKVDQMNTGSRDLANSVSAELKGLIDIAVPDDFLLRMYRLFSVIYKSKEKGGDVVVSVLRALSAPNSVFETHDLLAIGVRVKRSARCYGWLTEEIAKAIQRVSDEQGKEAFLAGKLRRILSSAATGDIAVAEIVRKRRNWWANEYRRKAKFSADRKVEYQIKSRLFRVMRVVVSFDSGVYLDTADFALVQVLESSARAYMRKRKVYDAHDPEPPDSSYTTGHQYCNILDHVLTPRVKYSDVWASFERSASYLVDDIIAILDYAAQDTPFAANPPIGDLDDDVNSDGDSEADPEDVLDPGEDNKEDVVDLFNDEDEEGDILGGDDLDAGDADELFGDDDEDDEIQKGMVDLAAELHEDYPSLPNEIIANAVSKFGVHVPYAMCAEIGSDLHAEYVRSFTARDDDTLPSGYDIRDH